MKRIHCSAAAQELKPIMFMILNQIASGGVNVFYKLAVADGMKVKILVVYRLVLASIFLAPIAFVFERKSRPRFSKIIALQAFVSGLLGGSLGSNLNAESIVLTSATFTTAMYNLIPALTFFLAVIFRLEKLEIRQSAGKAKVVGSTLSIAGAMVLSFYKGINVTLWSTHVDLLETASAATDQRQHQSPLLGSLLAVSSCFSYAAWYIIQTKMSYDYPCYSSTVLTCFSGAILAGIYALCTETRFTEWQLGWNIRLVASAYMGVIGSGLVIAVTAWGGRVKGPLYVTSFLPVSLIFVAIIGSIALGEKLTLGSVLGSVMIITGLYFVLWGKRKETIMTQSDSITAGEETSENASSAAAVREV
ncbi:WAT1-related protein At1g68170-like [Primulina eburnea]|uniref:WAT1-related protein At1g68170-like n=1 Tax=Primulina eburnea TaxID=1245227 RepID=UPI003C6BFDD6